MKEKQKTRRYNLPILGMRGDFSKECIDVKRTVRKYYLKTTWQ